MNKQPGHKEKEQIQRNEQGHQQLSLFALPVSPIAGRSVKGRSVKGRSVKGRSEKDRSAKYPSAETRGVDQRTRNGSRTIMINPHLLAARRIAKRMRRLPEHSDAETRAGLAICAQLKAFLADGSEETSPTTRH